jgi:hypothetical protein
MNAARVFGLISLIPDRTVRLSSGTLFSDAQAAGCKYPERVAHLSRFLSWLGPLDPISKEDQQILGLRAPNGRPIHAADLEEDEPMLAADLDDEALDEPAVATEERTSDAGTQIAA